jgi:4-alpha-glucanotransferase
MRFPRAGGILVHPTSLPGRHGIGDLGDSAHTFVDFLVRSKGSIWQILPLGPTGYGDSPYQCFSAFAGNPLLISPERLQRDGYLPAQLPFETPTFPANRVDFGRVIDWKARLFDLAFQRFGDAPPPGKAAAFDDFCDEQAAWLDDFALFMALKACHKDVEGGVWNTWPDAIARRRPEALVSWSAELAPEIELEKFKQFLFFEQWLALKTYANERNIRIVGDVPIFVAFDSADVWANPEIFYLDEAGAPTVVAGVPPDYFSATGQRWGNPLYRWGLMAQNGYAWWVERLRMTFAQVDVVRIDHFRGFDAYWEIPATESTAVVGRWVKGPGAHFFEAMREALGELPIIAEDLGVITPPVEALRDQFAFPGMKILQFAFGGERNSAFLPHNFGRNCVVYTGTHDNETTAGWYHNAGLAEQDHVRRYVARDGSDIAWDMIRLAYASVADTAVAPLQDLMSLGNEARMNFPGKTGGWWCWRFTPEMLTDIMASRLAELTELFGRVYQPPEEQPPPRHEIEIEDA